MKKSRILCLVLALLMVVSIAACDNGGGNDTTPGTSAPAGSNPPSESTPTTEPTDEPYEDLDWAALDAMEDWDEVSEIVYDHSLAEFYEFYTAAKEETENLDKRTALMAVAQAKLLESGVFLPNTTNGGNYAMSAIVPRTVTSTKWGQDADRYDTLIIADRLIEAEDRKALVELWNESADPAEYFGKVREFFAANGYNERKTYDSSFSDDIQTWDILASSNSTDSQNIVHTVDGLLRYDSKNVLQPNLAESYEVSEDGLTYTFHIRQGVKWVDQQGREIAEVKADDWVASMQHLADNPDELGYLMSVADGCGLKNFDEFVNGDITDFSEVGVKAIDDYTLQYTLVAPFSPFITMFGYSCMFPLCRSYYESKGGKFGADYDPSAADYTYGKTPADIAYCGAYLVSSYTPGTELKYVANPTYWNKDNVNIEAINLTWNDGVEALRSYNEAINGTIVATGFNASALVQAKQDVDPITGKTYFDAYSYVAVGGVYSYSGWYNLNRKATANFNDETVAVTTKTEDDFNRFRSAINNQHFRLALSYANDRGAAQAARVGEDLKYAAIRNAYVPGDFQYLTTDVTIDINGTAKTFPAGTAFGAITQAQLDADGYPIKCFDQAGNDGAGSSDGFDGWYNVDNARAELALAIEDLADIGIEVSADNPIIVDYPYESDVEYIVNQANVYKQSIEESLEKKVILNLIDAGDYYGYSYATFYYNEGYEANYDLAINAGWGPDYGDAQTFLDTIQPDSFMTKCLGLW